MIIVVFGLSAAGKTYVGKVLQKYFDFYHEDADNWLPEKMQDYVHQKKLFSFEMLDDYTQIIINKIRNLSQIHSNIVITQALYRQKNREQIQQYFFPKKIVFIQVKADDKIICQRIIDRGDWVSSDYAQEMHSYFQPMLDAKTVENNINGEDLLIKQLTNILEEENAEELPNRN